MALVSETWIFTHLWILGMSKSTESWGSDHDLFSSSPRQGTESALTDSIISAEGVALCLISRFSKRHLPRASELEWLVSEKDAPQQVLCFLQIKHYLLGCSKSNIDFSLTMLLTPVSLSFTTSNSWDHFISWHVEKNGPHITE